MAEDQIIRLHNVSDNDHAIILVGEDLPEIHRQSWIEAHPFSVLSAEEWSKRSFSEVKDMIDKFLYSYFVDDADAYSDPFREWLDSISEETWQKNKNLAPLEAIQNKLDAPAFASYFCPRDDRGDEIYPSDMGDELVSDLKQCFVDSDWAFKWAPKWGDLRIVSDSWTYSGRIEVYGDPQLVLHCQMNYSIRHAILANNIFGDRPEDFPLKPGECSDSISSSRIEPGLYRAYKFNLKQEEYWTPTLIADNIVIDSNHSPVDIWVNPPTCLVNEHDQILIHDLGSYDTLGGQTYDAFETLTYVKE